MAVRLTMRFTPFSQTDVQKRIKQTKTGRFAYPVFSDDTRFTVEFEDVDECNGFIQWFERGYKLKTLKETKRSRYKKLWLKLCTIFSLR